jgi:hypothetical protein
VPPLEAWEKVYVSEDFLITTHGTISCVSCHNGNSNASDKNEAHVGLIAVPSDSATIYCDGCHGNTVANNESSLHRTQNGYYTLFEKRAGFDLRTNPDIVEEFNKECGTCHTTCGQCHVSRPQSVDAGFVNGHVFRETPHMTNNCTACHGSRVGAEYLGQNEGFRSDVHWLPNGKRCEFCHEGSTLHGNGTLLETRYDERNTMAARCEECHEDAKIANLYHEQHWQRAETSPTIPHLSCQVCHSQDYKNCNECHTGGSGIAEPSYITYKIGKNPIQSQSRPYDYVVVRHIPIAPDTYASWGVASLANYDSEPTWKYATPHNIQRWTARTDTTNGQQCWSNCHNNWVEELTTYLRNEDLKDYELEANKDVVIPEN